MPKKILLIGGAGFIGSHLAKGLLKKGYEVAVVDREKGIDANNKEAMRKFFEKEKPEIVFNLAGAINLRKGESDSGLERAELICRLCRENKIKKLIFFSSGGAIYFDPQSDYAKANLEIEKIIQENLNSFIILRLGNVYGPGQWKEGIIPQIILNKDLVIRGDGNQTRNFVYVDDVVEAAILAMESDRNGIYNVDAGEEHTLNRVISLINKITGLVIIPDYSGEKDISAKAFDLKKTKKDFNWEPKTSLGQGLAETIELFKL